MEEGQGAAQASTGIKLASLAGKTTLVKDVCSVLSPSAFAKDHTPDEVTLSKSRVALLRES
jgi:hypothetical protein